MAQPEEKAGVCCAYCGYDLMRVTGVRENSPLGAEMRLECVHCGLKQEVFGVVVDSYDEEKGRLRIRFDGVVAPKRRAPAPEEDHRGTSAPEQPKGDER